MENFGNGNATLAGLVQGIDGGEPKLISTGDAKDQKFRDISALVDAMELRGEMSAMDSISLLEAKGHSNVDFQVGAFLNFLRNVMVFIKFIPYQ